MKPILSFKIEYGTCSESEIDRFANYIEDKLGDDYTIIFTPFEMTNPTSDAIFFNLDGINYTYKEIVSLLSKENIRGQRASMEIYDDKMGSEMRELVTELFRKRI